MTRPGENLNFIAQYIWENPGCRHKEVREALCRARGVDPVLHRGQYTIYFSRLINGRNYDHLWTNRGGRFFVTLTGMARIGRMNQTVVTCD